MKRNFPDTCEVDRSKAKKKRRDDSELSNNDAKRRKLEESYLQTERSSGSSDMDTRQWRSFSDKLWVAPSLRVRIIDTKFKKGKFYNSKVRPG